MKELICTKCSTPLIPQEEYPWEYYCPHCESNSKVTTGEDNIYKG